jgi:hypothetical protein
MYPRWHFGCLALGVLGYLQRLVTELLGVAPGASDIGGEGRGMVVVYGLQNSDRCQQADFLRRDSRIEPGEKQTMGFMWRL